MNSVVNLLRLFLKFLQPKFNKNPVWPPEKNLQKCSISVWAVRRVEHETKILTDDVRKRSEETNNR